MEETQATTTDQDKTEITIVYSDMSLERGTPAEIAAYDVRAGKTKPDDVDVDLLDDVYAETVTFEIADPGDADTIQVLEAAYRGVELGRADVDRTKYRSPMMGDVFVYDGTAYVVSRIGFSELELDAERFE